MDNKILTAIIACVLLLACAARAEQGGSGHYAQGSYLDFSAMPPSHPGFYFANYFMDYANGEVSGSKELPLGGIFAAGVTVNAQAEAPAVIYAYPWQPANITLSSGVYPSWVWVDVKATVTLDRTAGRFHAGRSNRRVDLATSNLHRSWPAGPTAISALARCLTYGHPAAVTTPANWPIRDWATGPLN
jgi:hypothetical protein